MKKTLVDSSLLFFIIMLIPASGCAQGGEGDSGYVQRRYFWGEFSSAAKKSESGDQEVLRGKMKK